MGRWDNDKEKQKKINAIEKKMIKINKKILAYIPKPIQRVMMIHAKWVNKHGIQLPVYQYWIIFASFWTFVFLVCIPFLRNIILVGENGLLLSSGNKIHTSLIEISVADFIVIVGAMFLFILVGVWNHGDGEGRKDDDPDSKDGDNNKNIRFEDQK